MPNTFHPMSNHIALQTWQKFLDSYSPRELRARVDVLKALCDDQSEEEIDCFLARVLSAPPLSFRKCYKVDYRTIAETTRSKWAKEEVRRIPKLDISALKVEYDLNDVDIEDAFIRPESFLYGCGLDLIEGAEEIVGDRDIIDGGAYRGESAAVLRTRLANSRVHAFEPDATNFAVLEQVAKKDAYDGGIIPVNMGLGARSFAANQAFKGHGTQLVEAAGSKGDLRVTSIDEYVSKTATSLGFFKLDVEGLEFDIVSGAVKTLAEQRPAFSIAIYHTPKDFLDIAPFIKSLSLDYELSVRHLHPQLTSFFGEFMLIGTPKRV